MMKVIFLSDLINDDVERENAESLKPNRLASSAILPGKDFGIVFNFILEFKQLACLRIALS
jgi:hypothetical protein